MCQLVHVWLYFSRTCLFSQSLKAALSSVANGSDDASLKPSWKRPLMLANGLSGKRSDKIRLSSFSDDLWLWDDDFFLIPTSSSKFSIISALPPAALLTRSIDFFLFCWHPFL